jgi:hypothetical protein
MSDTEMTQEQQDEATIAEYRALCSEFDAIAEADWSFANDQRIEELIEIIGDRADKYADASLRIIDTQAAEIERLRSVIRSAIVGLEVAGDFNLVAAALNVRDTLIAALAAPANGDGDGGADR